MYRLFLLLLLATPLAANAEIYKWTDAEGHVHFGDKPRDKGGKSETVEVKDYKPGSDENVRQIYERNDRLRDAVKEKSPAQQRSEAAAERHRQTECTEANDRLRRISGRVVFHDDQGKVVNVTEKERAVKEQELRTWISEHCQ